MCRWLTFCLLKIWINRPRPRYFIKKNFFLIVHLCSPQQCPEAMGEQYSGPVDDANAVLSGQKPQCSQCPQQRQRRTWVRGKKKERNDHRRLTFDPPVNPLIHSISGRRFSRLPSFGLGQSPHPLLPPAPPPLLRPLEGNFQYTRYNPAAAQTELHTSRFNPITVLIHTFDKSNIVAVLYKS